MNYGNILEGNLLNFSWLHLISRPYVFIAVELIAHEQREVRRAVSDIERFGKKATMNGELEQSALAADADFYSNRTYNGTAA